MSSRELAHEDADPGMPPPGWYEEHMARHIDLTTAGTAHQKDHNFLTEAMARHGQLHRRLSIVNAIIGGLLVVSCILSIWLLLIEYDIL